MKLMVNDHNIFLIVITTFIVSVLLVPIIKRLAFDLNAMDQPDERKIHKKPTPRLGGLAIFLAFLFGYMMFADRSYQMLSILIGSFIIVLIGIFDDIKPMKARYKLFAQLIASVIVVFYGRIVLTDISAFGLYFNFGIFSNIVTIVFIVAITNAINLIDGLDGLAAGISSIYFLTIAVIAFLLSKLAGLDTVLTLIMLGATLGFLAHNFPPASIFMGDTGSLFLGFIISIITLLGFKSVTLSSLIIPVLILAIPIIDTLLAIIRRILKGESIGTPDKDHFHHQLLKMVKSPTKTILLIYLVNALFAGVSIFYVVGDAKKAIVIYLFLMVSLLFFVLKTNIVFNRDKENKK